MEQRFGSIHTFSAQGSGCLMIGIGSTREGALAELNAAREGQDLPRKRQSERYERVAATSSAAGGAGP